MNTWYYIKNWFDRTKKEITVHKKYSNKVKKAKEEIRLHEKQGSTFPAKESILCNWCYYWEECPQKQGSNPFIPNYQ